MPIVALLASELRWVVAPGLARTMLSCFSEKRNTLTMALATAPEDLVLEPWLRLYLELKKWHETALALTHWS